MPGDFCDEFQREPFDGQMRNGIRLAKLLVQFVSKTNRHTTTKIAAGHRQIGMAGCSQSCGVYFDAKQLYGSVIKILGV